MSHSSDKNYLNESKGLWSWLTTLDHKRIGIMYLILILFFFCFGGLLALAVRFELLTPGPFFMTDKQYNQAFTLHGAIMVFLFIIPSIPAAFGNFILPLMIGAKDVAFPRLNLLSWYIYVAGGVIALSTLYNPADTGWTFYAPYSVQTDTAVITTVLAGVVLGFSSILTGVNFIATIHKMRAPGMTWFKMPLMVWALYATALIQILATPVIGITLLLLIVERVLGVGIFNPALGGDPVLFEHFFWFYSHPAVYIMILPAMGVMSELVTTFCKRNIFGYKFIAYSSISIAAISFLVWGHHIFLSGQSEFAAMIFSLLTFLVAIPSAIKIFNWLTTMYQGSIDLKTPFLYFVAFMLLFGVGGVTGIALALLSIDIHLHDTYYVVAHFHYTMMGGVLMAFFGALHYWWPKMIGKMYNEILGKIAFGLVFFGFNMTFFTQFILGAKGMPRRYHTYDPEFTLLHVLSTGGTWFLAAGFLLMIVYFIESIFKGKTASESPWGGITLEWHTSSPPIHHNFETIPTVTTEPYDYGRA